MILQLVLSKSEGGFGFGIGVRNMRHRGQSRTLGWDKSGTIGRILTTVGIRIKRVRIVACSLLPTTQKKCRRENRKQPLHKLLSRHKHSTLSLNLIKTLAHFPELFIILLSSKKQKNNHLYSRRLSTFSSTYKE